MKKAASLFILSLFFTVTTMAQDGGVSALIVYLSQRSTVLYSDTIFEIDGLKFKITETYSFRDKVKTTLILTNQSDQFKVLYSEDIAITNSENMAVTINKKAPMVVAPQSSKKFGLMAEGKSFKLYDIKINIKQIYTGTEATPIQIPGLFNLNQDKTYNTKAGPLEITSIKCSGMPGGRIKAYFKLNYTGNKFIGIHGEKATLLTTDKKAYPNIWPKSKYTFYPPKKASYNLLLEFENPFPNFIGEYCDKVSFENTFTEYTLTPDNKPFEFHVYKNGMQKGEDPKEIEVKENEVVED